MSPRGRSHHQWQLETVSHLSQTIRAMCGITLLQSALGARSLAIVVWCGFSHRGLPARLDNCACFVSMDDVMGRRVTRLAAAVAGLVVYGCGVRIAVITSR